MDLKLELELGVLQIEEGSLQAQINLYLEQLNTASSMDRFTIEKNLEIVQFELDRVHEKVEILKQQLKKSN